MVTVPAFVWRGGPIRWAATIGVGVGGVLGALAWLDSGMWFVGVIVLVIVGTFLGIWMSRRMVRYWPEATSVPDAERVALVGAARRGDTAAEPRWAAALVGYARGMREAEEKHRAFRWLIWLVLVVAVVSAVYDAALGSVGSAVASAVYLVALLFEVFWWPKRKVQILANCDRAAAAAEVERDDAV